MKSEIRKPRKLIAAFDNGSTPAAEGEIDLSQAPEDFDLTNLEGFVVDKGKHSFKAMIWAVKLVTERRPFPEIEKLTGMPKTAVTQLVRELQTAMKADPKKYKTVMAYLNAGRPFHLKNRDMLKRTPK